MAEKTTGRTETLTEFKRDVTAALSETLVTTSDSVKDFFSTNAETLVLAAMGINRSFGRIECQKSNGFIGAFAELVASLAVTRAGALVEREVRPFIESMAAQRDGLAQELRELALKEYESALHRAVLDGIQKIEHDAATRVTADVVADIEATVRNISPEFIANVRKALFDDVTKTAEDEGA